MALVTPAVLPSSRKDLEEKLALFAKFGVNCVQVDAVDGRFATPATWPYTATEELRVFAEQGNYLPYLDQIAYEVDLLCFDAVPATEMWVMLGATRLTFHAESAEDPYRLLADARRRYGSGGGFAPGLISFGLALNLDTDNIVIERCLEEINYVQFMGIAHVGQQGQPFDSRVIEKVHAFHTLHPNVEIQVDGGITLEYAKELLMAGATKLVVGSGILKATDPKAALAAFEALQSPFGV